MAIIMFEIEPAKLNDLIYPVKHKHYLNKNSIAETIKIAKILSIKQIAFYKFK